MYSTVLEQTCTYPMLHLHYIITYHKVCTTSIILLIALALLVVAALYTNGSHLRLVMHSAAAIAAVQELDSAACHV